MMHNLLAFLELQSRSLGTQCLIICKDPQTALMMAENDAQLEWLFITVRALEFVYDVLYSQCMWRRHNYVTCRNTVSDET